MISFLFSSILIFNILMLHVFNSGPVYDDILTITQSTECYLNEPLATYLFNNHMLEYENYDDLAIALTVGSDLYYFERNSSAMRPIIYYQYSHIPLQNKTLIERRDEILSAITLYFYQMREDETEQDILSHKIKRVSIAFEDEQIIDVIDNSILPDNGIFKFIKKLPCIEINKEDSSHYFAAAYVIPNDTYINGTQPIDFSQWYLGGSKTYHFHSEFGANIIEAWAYHRGEKDSVPIAIIGPGCTAHPDLQHNFFKNLEKNYGIDFADHRQHPFNEAKGYSWGTAVAGVIGSTSNNQFGTAGICWTCDIICLKVYHDDGTLNRQAIAEALRYVNEYNIPITYLGYTSPTYSAAEAVELEKLSQKNVLVITPAGDSSCDIQGVYPADILGCRDENGNSKAGMYPALYGTPNLLVVGSSESDGSLSRTTNWGSHLVHIMAPGSNIVSTADPNFIKTGYDQFKGTEMSAAIVTGTASLILSKNKTLTSTQIKDIIIKSARKIPSFKGICLAGGIIDAGEALKLVNGTNDYDEPHEYPYPEIDHTSESILSAISIGTSGITMGKLSITTVLLSLLLLEFI